MRAYRKIIAVGICILMVIGCHLQQVQAAAATPSVSGDHAIPSGKTISLSQAKALALSNSSEYSSLKSKLALAEVQYSQSVKSIQLRKKNQSTFRWTPLLNFKFPESPDLADEFEYTYEPIRLQSDIDTIRHQMVNNKYTVYEEVSLLYTECYTMQESIRFTQSRVSELEESLIKNQARLVSGQATEADIEKIESNLENLQSQLLGDMRTYETAKDKLSDCINLDVRSGYSFLNPYVTADISRLQYDYILSYTIERDEALYEAQVNTANSLLALNTNNQLMKNQYGSKMDLIDTFIQQVKNGEKIDASAFRLRYDEFLKKIDEPWQGNFKILFIKIPKEWIKGEIDGVRYVEDEPYALYEVALDYQDVYLEEQQVRKDLETQVSDGFNNYIAVRQTYEDLVENVAEKKIEVEKSQALNLIGQMTYEELSDLQLEYEELQMEELDALAEYTSVLVSYDKLTCGAISSILEGTDEQMEATQDGVSYVVAEEEEGAYYYIHSLAVDNAFEFGVYIPSGFETEITSYELWVNGTQIGERTATNQSIKHLALTFDSVETAFVRFYNGDDVVDDCDIDTEVYSGRLVITSDYSVRNDGPTRIASYSTTVSQTTGLLTISVQTDLSEIQFYDIKTADGTYLAGKEKMAIDMKFKYLGLVSQDLESLIFCFYDENQSLLYECNVDVTKKELIVTRNEE